MHALCSPNNECKRTSELETQQLSHFDTDCETACPHDLYLLCHKQGCSHQAAALLFTDPIKLLCPLSFPTLHIALGLAPTSLRTFRYRILSSSIRMASPIHYPSSPFNPVRHFLPGLAWPAFSLEASLKVPCSFLQNTSSPLPASPSTCQGRWNWALLWMW